MSTCSRSAGSNQGNQITEAPSELRGGLFFALYPENLRMTPETLKYQRIITFKPVHQQEVRPYVAVPAALQVSMKRVVSILRRKRYILRQNVHNLPQLPAVMQKTPVYPLAFTLEITPEFAFEFWPPHLLPSPHLPPQALRSSISRTPPSS